MDNPNEFDVQRLGVVASQLVARVRDDEPEANGRWLASQLPDPADWFRLAFALAAAVPVDRSWKQLTRWTHASPARGGVRRVGAGLPAAKSKRVRVSRRSPAA